MFNKNTMKRLHENFGLGDCSFTNLVWNVEWMLKYFGLSVQNDPQGLLTKIKYIVTFVAQFYAFQVGCILHYMYVVMPSGKSILQNIEPAMIYNLSVLNMGRLLWFQIKRQDIIEIINLGFDLDKDICYNKRHSEAISTKMRPVKIRCIVLWFTWMIGCLEHMVEPAFLDGRKLPDTYVLYPGLDPITETPNYEIGYTLQVAAENSMFWICNGHLILFISIVGHAAAHLRVLSDELHLLNGHFEKKHFHKNGTINGNFDRRLNIIICRHNEILNFVRKSSKTFSGIISFDFFVLGVILCTLMLESNSWLKLVGSLPKFSLPFFVITSYCTLGQDVIKAAEQFENTVYSFNWEDLDTKRRKKIAFIDMNAQTRLVFRCFSVVPLDHKTEMSIIRMVYSAYTSLHSIRKYG